MANSLEQVKSYLATLLDRVYQNESRSAVLDMDASLVRSIQNLPGSVLIPKMVLSGGLADYSKTTGAVSGDITLTWETFTLSKDRGRKFVIDAVDNIETAGVTLANLSSEFMRLYVIPELDAYRFGVYATKAGTKVQADLTSTTIEAAVNAAIVALKEKHVPKERLALFMTPTSSNMLADAVEGRRLITGATVEHSVGNYDGVPIFEVESDRFNTSVTLTSTGGFTLAGETINFLLMDRMAAVQVVKHVADKLFTPDQNVDADGYLWRYRVYHDAFVPDNKAAGIYCHSAAAGE